MKFAFSFSLKILGVEIRLQALEGNIKKMHLISTMCSDPFCHKVTASVDFKGLLLLRCHKKYSW